MRHQATARANAMPRGCARLRLPALALLLALAPLTYVSAQSVYRYQDHSGQWQFSDRPPADGRAAEVTALDRENLEPVVDVRELYGDNVTAFVASNEFHCPIEFELEFYDAEDRSLGISERFVLAARAEQIVAEITWRENQPSLEARYEYRYMLGDPEAEHEAGTVYRAPYALGQSFPVSQAYPQGNSHRGVGAHAVDFAMPEGTAVHAARAGVVVEIAYKSFRGGTSEADAERANLVRIMHADGTFAVYAHLAPNSVRVRPGDAVKLGEYIADSGNTGFSSGPHLHFAVERNTGFALEALPVLFRSASGESQAAQTGQALRAY